MIESHLHPEVFDIIKNGKKRIEMRINDEKRKNMHIGDTIRFIKRFTDIEEYIDVVIIDKIEYKNFSELIDNYSMEELYFKDFTKKQLLEELSKFYSDEEQNNNGVVAIKFEIK